MLRDIHVWFIRDDGKEFHCGNDYDWVLPLDGALDGFGVVENSLNYIDNATMDGGIITSSRQSKVDRTVKCFNKNLEGNHYARNDALTFFSAKHLYKLYITYNEITRWAEGYLYKFQIDSNSLHRVMNMMVTLTFPQPYWKSDDNFGKDIAEVTPMIAFPYHAAAPDQGVAEGVTGGIFNFASVITFENDGDTETYCRTVIRANGTVINPVFTVNDSYVRLIDTLQNGDEVIIDFTANPPKVTKNGINWIGHCDRTSDFDGMALPVGTSNVSFSADEGSNLMGVSIYYNKLYGAI